MHKQMPLCGPSAMQICVRFKRWFCRVDWHEVEYFDELMTAAHGVVSAVPDKSSVCVPAIFSPAIASDANAFPVRKMSRSRFASLRNDGCRFTLTMAPRVGVPQYTVDVPSWQREQGKVIPGPCELPVRGVFVRDVVYMEKKAKRGFVM